MTERPILFSAPMVRAIVSGTKTQTRRIVKDTGLYAIEDHHGVETAQRERVALATRCPYGQAGDLIWVKERHAFLDVVKSAMSQFTLGDGKVGPDVWNLCIEYCDGTENGAKKVEGARPKQTRERGETGWRPSIYTPRWASRITLEITGTRVERLQDISEDDAVAEGVFRKIGTHPLGDVVETYDGAGELIYAAPTQAREEYRRLWQSINGPGSWAANPWVWVVSFRRINYQREMSP